jgi:hypothetical protein
LTIRRLAYDDTEWRCTVGTQWPVPEWLDDTAEARHAVLPLAILSAWLEGLRVSVPSAVPAASVPRFPSESSDVLLSMNCDNFA